MPAIHHLSSVLCGVLLLGCVERPLGNDVTGDPVDTTGGGGEGGGETSGVPTTSGQAGGSTMPELDMTEATTPSQTDTGTTGTTGSESTGFEATCGFICERETENWTIVDPCDVFAQDCPEGEKCAAYAEGGGGSWDATKCVPVTGDGQAGDSCMTMGGGVSGLDDCAKGVMCWDVDENNQGICVTLCTGSQAAPVCPEGFSCASTGNGVINLCLPSCDPLTQECPGDDLCIPVNDTFVCVFDASGEEGQLFDACEFANACDKGLLCLNPSAAKECDPNAGGCCMPFCDLSDPNAVCPGVGTSCLSLYGEGQAPPKFENVGICVLPE